ncbi:hypothetical protein D9758_009135 [Tetrapyrgos nigripes]|uniref:HET-domain-containing protein n=1 Tax=Tetrapyrgos nigripes TaxID=182062 RepID=A0A8H5LK90_9AGAR|nr:hypothetical protein D9758_009135 [Tetrapyrgos nigripes]
MRLLSTKDFKVKEFFTDIPLYAILSHTWEQEEVTYQDIQNLDVAKSKAGFLKVLGACARARHYHFDWIWIDSCCINKESSAELSEALNSMYQYYEDAAVCYVYLSDVSRDYHPRSNFKDSRWFRRGWTLQELLAPEFVVFLDRNWERIGTRWSLRDLVSVATGIPVDVLKGQIISKYSIAQRMSWAAFRETTRPEDQAYCLMGIFGVSMSPIYGEGGAKAFMRLQQEIIRISDDRSIFAWVAAPSMDLASSEEDKPRGLLARSPYEFRMSGDVRPSITEVMGNKSSYSFNNNGLHIHLPLNPTSSSSVHSGEDMFLAHLLCQSTRDGSYLTIYLRKTSGHQYVRCYADEILLTSSPPAMERVRELMVREHLVTGRRFRISNTSGATKYNIELLRSAWDFLYHSSQPDSCIVSCIDEHTVSVIRKMDWGVIQYKSQKTGDLFGIDLTFSKPALKMNGGTFIRDASVRRDTLQGKLNGGGYIFIASERTGDPQEKIEIGYLAKDDPEICLWTSPLRVPDLGIIVSSRLSTKIVDYHLKFEGVFPPDPFCRITQDMVYATAFRPHPDDLQESHHTFRVLTFRWDDWDGQWPTYIIHVAFGLQGSSVWTDVVVQNPSFHRETSERVWKSYLESGTRAQKRTKGMEVKSKVDSETLTAVIQKANNLQLGDYLLRMHIQ